MSALARLWRWITDGPEDWRRSFNHENKNHPVGEPPLKFKKSIRLTEGPAQRGNGSGGPQTSKPVIIPTGQGKIPIKPRFPAPRAVSDPGSMHWPGPAPPKSH